VVKERDCEVQKGEISRSYARLQPLPASRSRDLELPILIIVNNI